MGTFVGTEDVGRWELLGRFKQYSNIAEGGKGTVDLHGQEVVFLFV
jgi:hypothetical protein